MSITETARRSSHKTERRFSPGEVKFDQGEQTMAPSPWQDILSQTLDLSAIERHHLIKGGLQIHLLKQLLATFEWVSKDLVLSASGLNRQTLSRRSQSRLEPASSGAVMALIDVTDIAQRVLGSRQLAEEWLTKPALALDGMRPLDLISTYPGIAIVKDQLMRIAYGVYA